MLANFYEKNIRFDKSISKYKQLMIADAQTSGGLLIAISEENINHLIDELKNQGCLSYSIIGTMKKKKEKNIYVI